MTKLNEKLIEELEKRASSDLLEVILELHHQPNSMNEQKAGSRTENIAALKEAFDRDIVPVEEAVRKIGGEITGHAWINRTLRARVPAAKLTELAEHKDIEVIDLPRRLTPDSA